MCFTSINQLQVPCDDCSVESDGLFLLGMSQSRCFRFTRITLCSVYVDISCGNEFLSRTSNPTTCLYPYLNEFKLRTLRNLLADSDFGCHSSFATYQILSFLENKQHPRGNPSTRPAGPRTVSCLDTSVLRSVV